jgi:hypothetical protein
MDKAESKPSQVMLGRLFLWGEKSRRFLAALRLRGTYNTMLLIFPGLGEKKNQLLLVHLRFREKKISCF